MDVIKNNIELETEIKKSKFITKIYKVCSLDDIKNILANLRQEHQNATHICYAYILEKNIKCSDDNEPSGTAGYPILQVLQKQNLDYILAVVIRYFGGVKLGASGLVRAYSNSVRDALLKKEITTLIDGFEIELKIPYEKTKYLDYLLKDIKDIKKTYQYEVIYRFKIRKEFLNNLSEFSPVILANIKVENND